MAITATVVDIRGKAYEPIIEEILFANATVADNLVSFETDIKAESIFTENINTAVMQAYVTGVPTSAGSLGLVDTLITPVKCMYYQEFAMESLRTSRFKRTMKPGAWNVDSSEFGSTVLASYGNLISQDVESKFWNGATSATKTAVAALTAGTANTAVGAAEQAYVSSASANLFDGVVTRMIYSGTALGLRQKVLGTTITATNIAAEYQKAYAAIPAVLLSSNNTSAAYIYANYSHKQLIQLFNVNATYRNIFTVSDDAKKFYYLGIEIKFVPVPQNCLIISIPDNIVWATDLLSDLNYMEINAIANNRDDKFIKNVFTMYAHVVNQKYNVLYLG